MPEPRGPARGERFGARVVPRGRPPSAPGFGRRALGLALLAGSLCGTGRAAADAPQPVAEPRSDRAAALFEQGIAALQAGHFESACPALEQSQALEATRGTLLALADCLERWQKLASASARYAEFIDAVSGTSDAETLYRTEQLAFARAALARLTPRIPSLRLSSRADLPSELLVQLDGRALSAHETDGEVLLDPGHHVLETRAVGHEPRLSEFELHPGEHLSVALELGAPLPAPLLLAPDAAVPRAPQPAPRLESPAAPGDPRTPSSAWRSVGWSLGGLGVAGVGVGAVAGTMLLSTCPGLDCAAHEERGKRLALITDIGLGVGVAALVSSVIVLVNTEPSEPSRDAAARLYPVAAVQARGGWLGMVQRF